MIPATSAGTLVVISAIGASASIAAALITAILGHRFKRRSDEQLERLRSSLDEAQKDRDAARDYRYEATKRLYTELQPLLFQLGELSDSAYRHAQGLARASRQGHLGATDRSWLANEYYLRSTVYRLLAPITVVGLIQQRLTAVDLTLDSLVRHQYHLAKAAVGVWNSGFDLAEASPALPYAPHDDDPADVPSDPSTKRLQHLFAGQLARIAASLTVRDGSRPERHCTFAEFEDRWVNDPTLGSAMAPAITLFEGFHPRTHRVLWRMLIAQAHLNRALALTTIYASPSAGRAVRDAISEDECESFDWREPSSAETQTDAVGDPFAAARDWLDRAVGPS